MAVTVPAPPYKTPIVDRSGFLSQAWATWFREVFQRIGGSVALSNTELEEAADLTDVLADIATLETQTDTNTDDIQDLQATLGSSGITTGRHL